MIQSKPNWGFVFIVVVVRCSSEHRWQIEALCSVRKIGSHFLSTKLLVMILDAMNHMCVSVVRLNISIKLNSIHIYDSNLRRIKTRPVSCWWWYRYDWIESVWVERMGKGFREIIVIMWHRTSFIWCLLKIYFICSLLFVVLFSISIYLVHLLLPHHCRH